MSNENGTDKEKEKAAESAAELGKTCRTVFIILFLGCVYCWLTVLTTTDAKLLTDSPTTPIPITGTEIAIGIATFYWLAPLILLACYFYFHISLQRYWEAVAGLSAKDRPAEELQTILTPWFLSGFVLRHLKDGNVAPLDERAFPCLESLASAFLIYWTIPLTLLGFWWRSLPVHSWLVATFHIVLLFLLAWGALVLCWQGRLTLQLRQIKAKRLQHIGWRFLLLLLPCIVPLFVFLWTILLLFFWSRVFDFETPFLWFFLLFLVAGGSLVCVGCVRFCLWLYEKVFDKDSPAAPACDQNDKATRSIHLPFGSLLARWLIALMLCLPFLWVSVIAIEGEAYRWYYENVDDDFDLGGVLKEAEWNKLRKQIVAWVCWRVLPDLRGADVSVKPED